jgi:mercuric ion binding protein
MIKVKGQAMSRILVTLSLAAAVLASGAASAGEQTVTLAVENMYCDACPYIVKQSLTRVPGVTNVAVSFEQKTATVTYDDQKTTLTYDDQKTTLDALTSATTQAGYPSRVAP